LATCSKRWFSEEQSGRPVKCVELVLNARCKPLDAIVQNDNQVDMRR
jgi:hypothetical protein